MIPLPRPIRIQARARRAKAAPLPPRIEDKSQVKLTEAEIFNSLDAAYGKLSVYDERIATCVEEFNANFLANSMDARTASKEFADKVLSDLQEDLKGLEAMHIPQQSAYAEQAAAVVELYECQIGRVSAMTNAWALDVTFGKPSEHKDESLGGVYAGKREGAPCSLRRTLRRLEALEGFVSAPLEGWAYRLKSRPLPKRAAFFIILLDESL